MGWSQKMPVEGDKPYFQSWPWVAIRPIDCYQEVLVDCSILMSTSRLGMKSQRRAGEGRYGDAKLLAR
jgi:hypothetical protein